MGNGFRRLSGGRLAAWNPVPASAAITHSVGVGQGPRPPKRAGAKLTEETCPAPKPEPGPIKPEAAKVKPKPKRDPDAGRLPDGAEFTAKYDAKAKRWTGKLKIGDAVFD
jgi:hypothetical protein